MSGKHTPGPWKAERTTHGSYFIHAPNLHQMYYLSVGTSIETHEHIANARLIAAAPELLAALELMMKWADACYEKEVLDAARSAIAKAKGESNE